MNNGGQFINPKETITKSPERPVVSASLSVAKSITEYQLQQEIFKFEGFLAAASTCDNNNRVPRPPKISSLRKSLNSIQEAQARDKKELLEKARKISVSNQVSLEEVEKILLAAEVVSQEIEQRGLIYRGEPFNFALTTPYLLDKQFINRLADLSTQSLQILFELAQEDNYVAYLLNRGSTPLEQAVWQKPQGYSLCAPINRIDLLAGKIIEFGPTFTDGFATAQILAETWGISSTSVRIAAETFISLYQEFCFSKGKTPKPNPSLGLIYIGQTKDMKDELLALGKLLLRTDKFQEIAVGSPEEIANRKPDILFYYLKPSMIDGYLGNPIPEGRPLIDCYTSDVCVIPPLKEQLGKKVVLAIIRMYPEYFSKNLGKENYEELLSVLAPTKIVTPNLPFPTTEVVLKPSSGGSCDGVIDSNDPLFPEKFKEAQGTFTKPDEDIWVIQPKLTERVPSLWVRNRKGLLKIKDLLVKQTLMVAGGKFAGAFATASPKWVIDDGGFNFPCKVKEKNEN